MTLFLFKRSAGKPSDYVMFAIPANTQPEAEEIFQNFIDRHEIYGSGEPWRNHWFLNIAGKADNKVFSIY